MHRTGIAFLAATLVAITAIGASAAPVATNVPIYQGWNLIAPPTVPLDPDPAAVFSGYSVGGSLFRWDPLADALVPYDEFTPEQFGNILLGDGYWFLKGSAGSGNVSYSGADVSGDHWISLPSAGWSLVGYPNLTPASVDFASLQVTNGIETKSIADAAFSGWIGGSAFYYDAQTQTTKIAGLPDEFPDTEQLEQNKGYWFLTQVDNLALIIPGGS